MEREAGGGEAVAKTSSNVFSVEQKFSLSSSCMSSFVCPFANWN